MSIKRIDGIQLHRMLKNGLAYLRAQIDSINELNVFPVADGDTGNNMYQTLENGLTHTSEIPQVNAYLKQLSEGMLLGARGNSGVILSQFFKGFSTELSRKELIGPGELRNGLVMGYRMAYKSVLKPVEGTMLTVAREGIENIRGQITRSSSIESILSMYVAEMKKSLSFTPELLPVLKEANVVDSGAVGFIVIFEGMLKYLYGEIIQSDAETTVDKPAVQPATTGFNENSVFEDGYCMEFILQLMKSSDFNPHFELNKFVADLQLFGNSIVAAQDGTKVKVHIHTLHPARTVSLCEEYGVFVDFKLENMQLQHAEMIRKKNVETPKGIRKKLHMIASVNGEGFRELFENLGCDEVISVAPGLRPSVEDYYQRIISADADRIIVFTNDQDSIPSAKQAIELSGKENVLLLETRNPVEGYFDLAMDIPDDSNPEYRIRQIQSGTRGLEVCAVAKAVKEAYANQISCKPGEYVFVTDGEVRTSDFSLLECIKNSFSDFLHMEDKESCVVFTGKDATQEETEILFGFLETEFPDLEVAAFPGGQSAYIFMIGIN